MMSSIHFEQKRSEERSKRESPKEQTSPNKSEARVTEKVEKNGEGEMGLKVCCLMFLSQEK